MRKLALLFLTFLLLSAVANAQQEVGDVEFRIDDAATFKAPRSATFSKTPSRGLDFQLYKLTIGDDAVLSFYVGSAPNFPQQPPFAIATINGCATYEVIQKVENKISRDIGFELESVGYSSTALHLFYKDLDPVQAADVDRVIQTIRLSHPERCVNVKAK